VSVSLEQAQRLVQVALAEAERRGVKVSVAVVDAGGLAVATARMDQAIPLSGQVAEAKALGAALWRKDGDAMERGAVNNPAMFQQIGRLPLLRLPLMPSDGSRVLLRDGVLEGGVGVAGGPAEVDRACADAAAQEFQIL
jgi:glc operon protein GlcG